MARDFWFQVLVSQRLAALRLSSRVFWSSPDSTGVLETLWRRLRAQNAHRSFGGSSWDNDDIADATITVDAALKERLSDLASQTGRRLVGFVEALLRRVAEADVSFERGVPVFPRRQGAPTLTVADVDRLADGQ